jgi:hypothetical protein
MTRHNPHARLAEALAPSRDPLVIRQRGECLVLAYGGPDAEIVTPDGRTQTLAARRAARPAPSFDRPERKPLVRPGAPKSRDLTGFAAGAVALLLALWLGSAFVTDTRDRAAETVARFATMKEF